MEFAPAPDPGHWPPRERLDLHDELHARPAMPLQAPGVITYWVQRDLPAERSHAALQALAAAVGQAAPLPQARHVVVHAPHFDLRFERHGEFVSWQVAVHRPLALGPQAAPWASQFEAANALHHLPARFVDALRPWPLMAATQVGWWRGPLQQAWPAALGLFDPTGGEDFSTTVLAGSIADGQAAVLTDLKLDAHGFTRFVLLDEGLRPDRAARDVQRLCEIEAYRMLAMLGFPVAQAEGQALRDIEQRLQHIVDDMANARTLADTEAFEALLHLAADIEHTAARTRYRLSATRAYHRIVTQRLKDLEEQRLKGHMRLAGFFDRRFKPAMALCDSTDQRITDMADRVNRAVDLARVRVEAQREANNQALLSALARRQQLQLRLQQTVEGLSVVAISYYAVSLVAYGFKAFKGLTLPGGLVLQAETATALAVLPVVVTVAWMVRRIRRLTHD